MNRRSSSRRRDGRDHARDRRADRRRRVDGHALLCRDLRRHVRDGEVQARRRVPLRRADRGRRRHRPEEGHVLLRRQPRRHQGPGRGRRRRRAARAMGTTTSTTAPPEAHGASHYSDADSGGTDPPRGGTDDVVAERDGLRAEGELRVPASTLLQRTRCTTSASTPGSSLGLQLEYQTGVQLRPATRERARSTRATGPT